MRETEMRGIERVEITGIKKRTKIAETKKAERAELGNQLKSNFIRKL